MINITSSNISQHIILKYDNIVMTRQNNPKIQTGNGTSCSKTKKIPKKTDKKTVKENPFGVLKNLNFN